jgi:hypothetical protein
MALLCPITLPSESLPLPSSLTLLDEYLTQKIK